MTKDDAQSYSFVFIGPGNKPIFVLTGEGHREELDLYVDSALHYFDSRISNLPLPIEPLKIVKGKEGILHFPSKVCSTEQDT